MIYHTKHKHTQMYFKLETDATCTVYEEVSKQPKRDHRKGSVPMGMEDEAQSHPTQSQTERPRHRQRGRLSLSVYSVEIKISFISPFIDVRLMCVFLFVFFCFFLE